MNEEVAVTTVVAARAEHASERGFLALLFGGFVLLGIPTVIIGPILPIFISRWSLDDSQAGAFFSVQFAASLGGVWLATFLTHRYSYRMPLFLGYIFTGVGLAFLNASTHGMALAATTAFGLGYGMAVPPTNLSAAEAGGERSAGLVSLLNFAWGIGAVSCSPLILLANRHHLLSMMLIISGTCSLVIAALFLVVAFPADTHASPAIAADSADEKGMHAPTHMRLSAPGIGVTIAVAALFFLYVGMETSIGGWAAEAAKRLAGPSRGWAIIAPMFFYGGLMTGRALAPLALLRLRENRLTLGALATAALGVMAVIAAKSQAQAIAGLVVAGLGCASIYPIYIAWLAKWYGAAARRLGGLMFSMASVGGAAIPWLVGFVSKESGSLRIGLAIPLVGSGAMAAILLALRGRVAAEDAGRSA